MTITTNAVGVATTGENALPYGEYTVRESATNDSMLKTFDEEISVTISEDGQMLEYEAENEVVRGRHWHHQRRFSNRLYAPRQRQLCRY